MLIRQQSVKTLPPKPFKCWHGGNHFLLQPKPVNPRSRFFRLVSPRCNANTILWIWKSDPIVLKSHMCESQVLTLKFQSGPELLWLESRKTSKVIAQDKQVTSEVIESVCHVWIIWLAENSNCKFTVFAQVNLWVFEQDKHLTMNTTCCAQVSQQTSGNIHRAKSVALQCVSQAPQSAADTATTKELESGEWRGISLQRGIQQQFASLYKHAKFDCILSILRAVVFNVVQRKTPIYFQSL